MLSTALRTPFFATIRRLGILPTPYLATVDVAGQTFTLWEKEKNLQRLGRSPKYRLFAEARASTSRFGIGQVQDSNKTPLGLHRIAQKIGGGFPQGTVFRGRKPVGFTWKGMSDAPIAHRIFWLEGLEPGFNRGNGVDSFKRYIYIHGFSDETTLGRPASHGCIHLAAQHLIPLYDWLPLGTLVWIHQ
jgi:lipoprotein-anchoring transpeptidase ErfK/SrfK